LQRPPGEFKLMYGGSAVLLARLCHELRIQPLVNSMVEWDPQQCKVSPGSLVVALIINMLIDRSPLYQVEEFYKRRDLELFFPEPVEAAALNDDALGRTLDRLAAIDLPQLVQSVALCAIRVGKMEVRSVHADTTSVSVTGEYPSTFGDLAFQEEHPEKKLIAIDHGYSKQHRPDLKQFLCGMIVSKDGLPVYGDIRDGSYSDKLWNREVLAALEKSFLDPQTIVYVADSSLVTKKNLQLMAERKVKFISRLPEVFNECQQAKDKVFTRNKWLYVGALAKTPKKDAAIYHVASTTCAIDGNNYRLLVTQSSAHDRRTQKKLERTISKESDWLKKAGKALMQRRFACLSDAETALQEFIAANEKGLHKVKGMVIAFTETKFPPGRPRKDADYPRETSYQVDIQVFQPTEKDCDAWLKRESSFVLITNLPEDTWSDAAVLEEYKNQYKVERQFMLFKHPITADGIFLKSKRRVEAFGYVVILALLLASFLQYRVRTNLAKTKSKLHLQLQERTTDSPTSLAILKELHYVTTVLYITPDNDHYRYLNDTLPAEHLQLLELAGYTTDIYLEPLLPGN
jgi:transposase